MGSWHATQTPLPSKQEAFLQAGDISVLTAAEGRVCLQSRTAELIPGLS